MPPNNIYTFYLSNKVYYNRHITRDLVKDILIDMIKVY